MRSKITSVYWPAQSRDPDQLIYVEGGNLLIRLLIGVPVTLLAVPCTMFLILPIVWLLGLLGFPAQAFFNGTWPQQAPVFGGAVWVVIALIALSFMRVGLKYLVYRETRSFDRKERKLTVRAGWPFVKRSTVFRLDGANCVRVRSAECGSGTYHFSGYTVQLGDAKHRGVVAFEVHNHDEAAMLAKQVGTFLGLDVEDGTVEPGGGGPQPCQ